MVLGVGRGPYAVARSCRAPALPGSPCPRYRHPSMSGADPRRGRSTPTTIARPCQEPAPPGSSLPPPPSPVHLRRRPRRVRPCPRHHRPPMSGADPRRGRSAPTTVIPAKAGIQVGFHGNGRAAGRAGGRVGHRRRTRVCGVLCGGTNLDPRLRGDDGREGVRRSAEGEAGQGRGVCCGVRGGAAFRRAHGAAERCSCRGLSLPCLAPPRHRHPSM